MARGRIVGALRQIRSEESAQLHHTCRPTRRNAHPYRCDTKGIVRFRPGVAERNWPESAAVRRAAAEAAEPELFRCGANRSAEIPRPCLLHRHAPGNLPPDVANPPSLETQIETQIEAQGVRTIPKNGYGFDVDPLSRTRHVAGEISLQPAPRSRTNQANAGGSDRRPTDDGGHYIAARFNGSREWFNHFAQDASFNRGAYRVLENGWASDVRRGYRVFVDILPHYDGLSRRPSGLTITWFVDGKRFEKEFANEKESRTDGRR